LPELTGFFAVVCAAAAPDVASAVPAMANAATTYGDFRTEFSAPPGSAEPCPAARYSCPAYAI
jgi:hypothetical protein